MICEVIQKEKIQEGKEKGNLTMMKSFNMEKASEM